MAIDWTKSMQQTFEYYEVNPTTWLDEKKLTMITSSSIERDSEADTLGSASIELDEAIGECYIRIYLIAIQNGRREKIPLATVLAQTPSFSFDGKQMSYSIDAYTPLTELTETQPPIGYFTPKNDNILKSVTSMIKNHCRAPVVETESHDILSSNFVTNTDDTWLSYISDLILNAKHYLDLDAMGKILLAPTQNLNAMTPIWTYTDDNSSILYPEIKVDKDLYSVPNIVEVVYTNSDEGNSSKTYYARAVNDDPNSVTSTISRGRNIVTRETSPNFAGVPDQKMVDEYAQNLLKQLSSIQCTVSYKHAYCPVRVNDCVLLNYKKAGINNVKAKVINQKIVCEPGCPVSEKATFSIDLWEGD